MLSRPISQTKSDDRGRGLSTVTPPPVLSLVENTGVFSSSPPPPPLSARSSSPPHTHLHPLSPPNPMFLSSCPPFVSSAPLILPPPVPFSRHLSSTLLSPSSSSSSLFSSSPPASLCASHPSPPYLLSSPSVYRPASFSSATHPLHPPHVYHHSSRVVSSLPSSLCSSVSSSTVHTPPSVPPPPAPCCSCASLLPRLLSAHRSEMRRLLRGAVSTLGRRLDALERRSRKKRRKKKNTTVGEGGACCHAPEASSTSSLSCAYSCVSDVLPPVTSSSSSSVTSSRSEGSTPSPALSCFDQSEQRGETKASETRTRRRKRRNKEEDEEENAGRFVGQMAVSFRGGGAEKQEGPITLHNFNHKKHRGGGTGQSEKTVSVIRPNGYTPPLLHSILNSSQDDVHLSAESVGTCCQSDVLAVSSGQWWFSDLTPRLTSNLSAFGLWLRSSSTSFNPASMLRFSVFTIETMMDSVRGGTYGNPHRPLKDLTAPPSVGSDHCYMRAPSLSLTFPCRPRQHKQRTNRNTRSLHLPRRRAPPLPPCTANGLSAPFPGSQSAASSEFLSSKGERGKCVSQIRIRRTSPRETPLTPMGLPKAKRLKKKEFSLEEIYTNKNYKSPTTNRSLETIFEEPREKDGALLLIGQQRRRRLLLFPDFTQPRKRKRPQGAWFPGGSFPRKRAAARRHCHGDSCGDDDMDLDVMLVERLSALEDFLTKQGLDV